ncbi:ComF family protein [Candidatus Daviesbacteria bacterium]|nr:ComF family protein [Candidatus Daviesbacteria bacterium]
MPVPLHQKREKWRGFNQSQIIAGELSRRTGIKVFELLVRLVNTRPQVELSGKSRVKNVAGVFAIRNGIGLKDKTCLLVDDLLTTGSTMRECAKVLKKAGARRVWAMAVVRT